MSSQVQNAPVQTPPTPGVSAMEFADVMQALRAGWRDFLAAPAYGLFFGAFYVLGGWFILASLFWLEMPWMIIPVAIGFPLIGPFVAVGLYEVSRRRSAGQPLGWREVLIAVFRQRERQLAWMAFVVLFIFWMWIYQVRLLLALFLGFKSFSSIPAFLEVLTTTPDGIGFLAVGTLVGAFWAMILFSATVISMPLLTEHEYDFVTAMITSFKTVFASPAVMLAWAATIAVATIVALLPAFAGLLIVLPVLGHATWHLYRRAIVVPAGINA